MFVYAPAILIQFKTLSSGVGQFVVVILLFLSLTVSLNVFWKHPLVTRERLVFGASAIVAFIYLFGTQNILLLIASGGLIAAGMALNHRDRKYEDAGSA